MATKSARPKNVSLNKMRAQQQAAEKRRRLIIAGSAVVGVIVVVAALVIASIFAPKSGPKTSSPLDPAVATTLSSIPASTFDTVARGEGVDNPPKAITSDARTKDGKPNLLFVGAEYCPYCAAERWPLTVAMMRFGQFSSLQQAFSGPAPENSPNTATLGYHGATFTSQYLSFTGYETQDNAHQPLDTLSAEDQAVFSKFDTNGSIPFLDFGGKAASSGASVDVGIFAGKSQQDIASAIADPTTPISKAVLGSANVVSAQICQMTNQQPAAVCSSSGVTAAAASLK